MKRTVLTTVAASAVGTSCHVGGCAKQHGSGNES
jgi:hypothetical protein